MMTDQDLTVGSLLKQSRLKQRLSTAECAKRTHIATRFIEALEDEKWSLLPSESHRLGFLKLYARFLGLSVDDVVKRYDQKGEPVPDVKTQSTPEPKTAKKNDQSTAWFPTSWPQAVLLGIAFLLLFWVLYHSFNHPAPEVHTNNLIRLQQTRAPRLVPPKNLTSIQKIKLTAMSDSWLRVTEQNHLLFEGILPAKTSKEWSGPGPFHFRFADTKAVNLWWNDQEINVAAGTHGNLNELQLPLPR